MSEQPSGIVGKVISPAILPSSFALVVLTPLLDSGRWRSHAGGSRETKGALLKKTGPFEGDRSGGPVRLPGTASKRPTGFNVCVPHCSCVM